MTDISLIHCMTERTMLTVSSLKMLRMNGMKTKSEHLPDFHSKALLHHLPVKAELLESSSGADPSGS